MSMFLPILSMEMPRPAARTQEQTSVTQELEQLLTIDPNSRDFAAVMRHLDAASNNVNDCDALMMAHVRATMLLSNIPLRSPQHSESLTRITSLRATLFKRIVGHYQNEQAANVALERFMSQFPDLQHFLRNDLVISLRGLRPQAAHPAGLVNVMRQPIDQSSQWQSSLLGQLALLWVIFRLLGQWDSPTVEYFSKLTGQHKAYVRPLLQIISFSSGQIIVSRNNSKTQHIIQSALPSSLFILISLIIDWECKYFNHKYLYGALYRLADLIGLNSRVETSYIWDIPAIAGMLATIAGTIAYENYDDLKKIFTTKRSNPDNQS